MLAQLDQVAKLTATVHERAQHSAAVAEMHEAFHAAADRSSEEPVSGRGTRCETTRHKPLRR